MKPWLVDAPWIHKTPARVREEQTTPPIAQLTTTLAGHLLRQLGRLSKRSRVSQNRAALQSFTFAMPFYPEIKLEFLAHRRLWRILREFQPDFIHITTEGPLGWAARRVCLHRNLSFSTAYHTRFPEYLAARAPRVLASIVRVAVYAVLRRFHASASVVMVATESIERELKTRKFRRLVRWSRGVDTNLFRPYGKDLSDFSTFPRPILRYVGRVAVEKNLRMSFWISTLAVRKPNRRRQKLASDRWRL